MLLNPNLEIFRGIPEGFKTPFASNDSKLSEKYQAIAKAAGDAGGLVSVGEKLLCQQQANAWHSGITLINFTKATVVGDILSQALPQVAWMSKTGPAGLFAKVAFPQSTNPDHLAEALARVALDVAIAAISSVAIVGQILGAVVQVAMFLYRIFTTPKESEPELLLPWSTYSANLDEDLVNHFLLQIYGQGVEWTPIWMPPYELADWQLNKAARDGKEYKGGQVWAPVIGGDIPYAEGQLGCIPNTIRVAGHLQRIPGGPPVAVLRRLWYDHGDIGWGGIVTNVGDFFPSTGQVAGGMWKQAERPGSPDMYKVDARAIKAAWVDYFGQFFDSGLSAVDPIVQGQRAKHLPEEPQDPLQALAHEYQTAITLYLRDTLMARLPGIDEKRLWDTVEVFLGEHAPHEWPIRRDEVVALGLPVAPAARAWTEMVDAYRKRWWR